MGHATKRRYLCGSISGKGGSGSKLHYENHFETTSLAVVGPGRDSEGRFLKRTICWVEHKRCPTWFRQNRPPTCVTQTVLERMVDKACSLKFQTARSGFTRIKSPATQTHSHDCLAPSAADRIATQYIVKNLMRKSLVWMKTGPRRQNARYIGMETRETVGRVCPQIRTSHDTKCEEVGREQGDHPA